jgi:hypothetical protein
MDAFASFCNFLYSFRLGRGGEMKISFARLPPREVCSTLDHSSTFLSLMMVLLSLGNVFDRVRFL